VFALAVGALAALSGASRPRHRGLRLACGAVPLVVAAFALDYGAMLLVQSNLEATICSVRG
jgi:hypothetical protein